MASSAGTKKPSRRQFRRLLDTEDEDFLDMLLTEANEEEAAELLGEIRQFGEEDGEDRGNSDTLGMLE
jgi:succinate dehydrogenase flavin-adding protein (antitoxin of CptAB toxin-antitoxin module)